MVGAPLASAVAADLAILRIENQLLLAVLTSALPLARLVRTCSLLRVKSGEFELPPAETATLLIHPFRVGLAAELAMGGLPEREFLNWKRKQLYCFGRRSAQLNGLAG